MHIVAWGWGLKEFYEDAWQNCVSVTEETFDAEHETCVVWYGKLQGTWVVYTVQV